MKYIITEMQTDAEGVTAFLEDQKDNMYEAESVYFTKLASAAISNVPLHTVVLMTNDGFQLDHKSYDHRSAD